MQVNIRQAKSQLPKLIKAALAGEEVIIAKGKRPVVKLVPALPSTGYRLGGLAGIIPPPADSFFDPMTEDELREWE
jgi:antitoxin (DNA-binding transcriptional repressor) of toxin-antitoxin stability system